MSFDEVNRLQWMERVVSFLRCRSQMFHSFPENYGSNIDLQASHHSNAVKSLRQDNISIISDLYALANIVKPLWDQFLEDFIRFFNIMNRNSSNDEIRINTSTTNDNESGFHTENDWEWWLDCLEAGNVFPALIRLPIKSKDRLISKAQEFYNNFEPKPAISWINDIIRASIVCSSLQQLESLVQELHRHGTIIKIKNRFAHPTPGGYRDVLIYIQITDKDDHRNAAISSMTPSIGTKAVKLICELQVHVIEVLRLSLLLDTQSNYRYFRRFFGSTTDESEIQRRIKVLMKIDQQGNNPHELETLINGYVNGLGRVSRDIRRLSIFYDLFILTSEHDLAENVQRYIIGFHRRFNDQSIDLSRALGKLATHFISLRKCEEALVLCKEAVHLCEVNTTGGFTISETVDRLTELAGLFCVQGRYLEAVPVYQRIVDIFSVSRAMDDVELFASRLNLAELYEDLEDWPKAIATYQTIYDAYELIKRARVAADVFKDANNVNILNAQRARDRWKLLKKGRTFSQEHADSAPPQPKTLSLARTISGHGKGETHDEGTANDVLPNMALTLACLGHCYESVDNLDEALARHTSAMNIFIEVYGLNDETVAICLTDIANIHDRMGKLNLALSGHRQALSIFNALWDSPYETAESLNCIGELLIDFGRYGEAIESFRRALTILSAQVQSSIDRLVADELAISRLQTNIGEATVAQVDLSGVSISVESFNEIKSMLSRALETQERHLGPQDVMVIQTRGVLQRLTEGSRKLQVDLLTFEVASLEKEAIKCRDEGRFEDAMHFLELCEDRLRGTFDRQLIYISIVSTMATVREDEGRFEESEVLCRQVLTLLTEALGSHPHLMTARAHFNLGLVQMRKDEPQIAADSFQTALSIFEKTQENVAGKNESLIDFSARVRYSLGQCFHSLGQIDSAQEILESVADLRLSYFGDSDPEFTAALNALSLVLGKKQLFNAALDCAEHCYALREQVCGGRSPSLITIQNNLAIMHLLLSTKHNIVDVERRAEEMLTKSLESRTIITNYASREVEVALLNLANMFLLNDDYDKDVVDPLLHGAASIREELDNKQTSI